MNEPRTPAKKPPRFHRRPPAGGRLFSLFPAFSRGGVRRPALAGRKGEGARAWLSAALLGGALAVGCIAGVGCGDATRGAGDRCATARDCEPPLICSNRDHPALQGICVWPEALPDAAVTPDASGR